MSDKTRLLSFPLKLFTENRGLEVKKNLLKLSIYEISKSINIFCPKTLRMSNIFTKFSTYT